MPKRDAIALKQETDGHFINGTLLDLETATKLQQLFWPDYGVLKSSLLEEKSNCTHCFEIYQCFQPQSSPYH